MTNNSVAERRPFLMNAWYCASWSHDLGSAPLSRTILDVPVVLYRTEAGRAVAARDECPHRFAPLSSGQCVGDLIVCPYHGLKFDPQGNCVDARYSSKGNEGPRLRVFPLVEKQNVIWIWMGDPARAADVDPIDLPFFDNPERPKIFGTTHVKANYELENDNLLDLSHLDYVHRSTIAQGFTRVGKFAVEQNGNRISSTWRTENVEMPIQYLGFYGGKPLQADTWSDIHWSPPSALFLDTGVVPVGGDRSEALGTLQAHLITPETTSTSTYFWGLTISPAMAPALEAIREAARSAFEDEDRPVVEAVQRRLGNDDFWARQPIVLREDAAAVRARRTLEKLIRAEVRDV